MITISVPTWNELFYTKNCIKSLSKLTFPFRLHIFDNRSTDKTVEYLKSLSFPYDFYIHYSDINTGVTFAWNMGLKHAFETNDDNYCLIINNDIEFNTTFNNIIPFAQEFPEFGVIGPRFLPKNIPPEDAEEKAKEFINLEPEDYKHEIEGSAMLISKDCFKTVGYFDERLKITYNDCDYHDRTLLAGFGSVLYNRSWIYHKGKVSSSKISQEESDKYRDIFRGKY